MLDIDPMRSRRAGAPSLQNDREVEIALVEVSHRLVTADAFDMVEVLSIIGAAMGAECTFLSISDWTDSVARAPSSRLGLIVWHSEGSPAARKRELALRTTPLFEDGGDLSGPDGTKADRETDTDRLLAVPLLAEGERFIGFLGVEGRDASNAGQLDRRQVLSVFGDLLANYYRRLFAERALQENQERWRTLMQLHPDPVVVSAESELLYVNRAAARLFGGQHPRDVLAFRLDDFLPADQQPSFWRLLRDQLERSSNEPFEQEVTRLDGEERVVEVLSAPSTFDGRTAAQIVLRDVTDRIASEERYRTFVETISEGVWRIDMREPVPIELDVQSQVAQILRCGVLAECNEMMARMMGLSPDAIPFGKVAGEAFSAMGKDAIEAFVRGGYRLENFDLTTEGRHPGPRHFSLNAVGRLDRGRLLRIWGSCNEITARVEMERRMVAVLEEEQERIGRDLHDGVGQLLTGIRMLSENLFRRVGEDDPAWGTMRNINSFAVEASQRVRDICRGLAPPQLSQEPLAVSLEMLLAQLNSYQTAECAFDWDHNADVDSADSRIQLFRIAQEATNNALRHAQPRRIVISLRAEDSTVILEVADDGCGFDVESTHGHSLGLYSMHRRASSIRARLTIESGPGAGTRVRAEYNNSTAA